MVNLSITHCWILFIVQQRSAVEVPRILHRNFQQHCWSSSPASSFASTYPGVPTINIIHYLIQICQCTVWMQYYSMSVWWRFWQFLRFIEKCLRVSLFRTAGGNLRRAPESNIGDSSAGGITERLNGFNAQSGSIWRICIHLQAHFRKSLSSISHLLCSILWWIWWITAKLQLKRHPNCWMVMSGTSKTHQPCRWQVFQ